MRSAPTTWCRRIWSRAKCLECRPATHRRRAMRSLLRGCMQAAGLLLAGLLLTAPAAAQTAGNEGLSPALAAIKQAHVVRLGYRESSPPFSFMDPSNRPIGYSLELCEAIVEEIGIEVDDANLRIDYVKVTSDDRIPAVTQHKIDLES